MLQIAFQVFFKIQVNGAFYTGAGISVLAECVFYELLHLKDYSCGDVTDMPLLRVYTEISVFFTPSLCWLRISNNLIIFSEKWLTSIKSAFQGAFVLIHGPFWEFCVSWRKRQSQNIYNYFVWRHQSMSGNPSQRNSYTASTVHAFRQQATRQGPKQCKLDY